MKLKKRDAGWGHNNETFLFKRNTKPDGNKNVKRDAGWWHNKANILCQND